MKTGKEEKGGMGLPGDGTDAMPGAMTEAMTDAMFERVLGDFQASAQAWSEAAYSRRRSVAARHWSWRLAAGWALGCAVGVGSLTGGLVEHHLRRQQAWEHSREHARPASAGMAQQQQPAVEEEGSAADDSDLLATVDTDVSQAVPSAMEPLQLTDDDAKDGGANP